MEGSESNDAGHQDKQTSKPDTGKRNKLIILGVGIFVCVAGVATLVAAMLQAGPVDYESEQPIFTGAIQFEENEEGMVKWSDEYNDLQSAKAQQLITAIAPKMKHAIDAEGFSVDDVEITALEQTQPVTVTRKELVSQPKTLIKGVNLLDQLKTETKTYPFVKYVRAKFAIRGRPIRNAATFRSAKPDQLKKVGRLMATRLSSTGWTSRTKEFEANPQFSKAVESLVSEMPKAVTKAPIAAQFDSALPCTCDTTSADLSTSNPLMACMCDSSCTDDSNYIYGGVENRFTCVGSSVCATAYYAGIIGPDGGEFEVIYSGKGTVEKGPEKDGFDVNAVDVTMGVCTYKEAGEVISATTPFNPVGGGSFRTTTPVYLPPAIFSGGDDEPQFSPDFPFDGTEHVVVHIKHTNIGGRPTNYRPEYEDVKHKDVVDWKTAAEPQYVRIFGKIGINYDKITLRHVVEPQDGNGIVFGLALGGDAGTIASV